MQLDNKWLDDLARLGTSMAGGALEIKREIETLIADKVERMLTNTRFVSREEFEVVRAMAEKAREENEALRSRLEALEGK